eukprot:jgi/Mesvir1/7412/Mv19199-RA.2
MAAMLAPAIRFPSLQNSLHGATHLLDAKCAINHGIRACSRLSSLERPSHQGCRAPSAQLALRLRPQGVGYGPLMRYTVLPRTAPVRRLPRLRIASSVFSRRVLHVSPRAAGEHAGPGGDGGNLGGGGQGGKGGGKGRADGGPQGDEENSGGSQPSWPWLLLRSIAKAAALLGVLAAALVVLAPTLLSTGPGQSLCLFLINRSIPGTLSWHMDPLSWRAPLALRDVTLKTSKGETVLAIQTLASSLRLVDLVTQGLGGGIGSGSVVRPYIDLSMAPNGQIMLFSALEDPNPDCRPTTPPIAQVIAFAADIHSPNGNFFVTEGRAVASAPLKEILGNGLVHFDLDVGPMQFGSQRGKPGWAPPGGAPALPPASAWGRQNLPFVLSVRSPSLEAGTEGRLQANGVMKLNRPLEVKVDLSRALCDSVLSRLNPLLSGLVSVEGGQGASSRGGQGQQLCLQVAPHKLQLPAERYALSIQPLQLVGLFGFSLSLGAPALGTFLILADPAIGTRDCGYPSRVYSFRSLPYFLPILWQLVRLLDDAVCRHVD